MYTFPISLLAAQSVQPWLANTRVDGGNMLNGVGQEADWSGGGYWAMELTSIRVTTDAQHLEWVGFCTEFGNGFTGLTVPMLISPGMMPLGDATPETMDFAANADANLTATSIDIKVNAGGAPGRGMRFTIVHPNALDRAYSIISAVDQGGGVWRCVFGPPLREAVTAGTAIDFFNVRVCMTARSAAKDIWPKLLPPYKATPNLQCLEDFSYQDALA